MAVMSAPKYRSVWEQQFSWAAPSPDNSSKAMCKICKKSFLAKKSGLAQHEKTTEHRERVKGAASSPLRGMVKKTMIKSVALKAAEVRLSAAVCCHTSISAIDHFGEVIQTAAKGSVLEDLHLHRTKASRLIDHVLSPTFKEELKADIEGAKYSILCDESTDVSVEKNMCICVIYFSLKSQKIETAFLGLYRVVETTGAALFAVVEGALQEYDMPLTNCVGFGSDGASNMVGVFNSLWSRIRDASPNCVLFKCICHSLALCTQKAFNTLPSNLGYILHEVSSWFSKSTLRREEYKNLFQQMQEEAGDGEEDKGPLPFMKTSTTRWLVRGKLISNILLNWEVLKVYFQNVERGAGQDVRYKAKIIKEMLHDDLNYLYFLFLSPIIKEFDQVNCFFQATRADPEEMVKELDILHQSLKQRIKDKTGNTLALSLVDFGASFASESERLKRHHASRAESFTGGLQNVKSRCLLFLEELLGGVEARLPGSRAIFRGLSGLNPSRVLSQSSRLDFQHLPSQHLMGDKDAVQSQYRKVILHIWTEEEVFNGELPRDSSTFWAKILQFKRSDRVHPYEDLAKYALAALAVPVSNAVVERIFSHVTWVKSKYRNRMSLKTLDAILRVRLTLQSMGICCTRLEVSKKMLDKFNSAMYIDEKDVGDISALL